MNSEKMPGNVLSIERAPRETTVFGVPIGRLGLFARVVMAGVCGFIAFLVTFVLAIIGLMIYDSARGISMANLNLAYLRFAAPAGILVLLASLIYLVADWGRQRVTRAA